MISLFVLIADRPRRDLRRAGRAVRLRRARPLQHHLSRPTLQDKHLFGTDLLGRDYLSRVIFGLRTSLWVALFVAFLSTSIGTAIGALAGYYGGVVDNLLMRFTDLILTLPGLAVLLTAAAFFGTVDPLKVGVILALLFWTGIARIVRGVFLSLREKEYVEAAKASGASDMRGSSSATCSRTRSGRSSSTRR